jgi:hypothetical protein
MTLPCRREAPVCDAARQGTLAGALAAHAAGCPACARAAAAGTALRQAAAALSAEARLPDPSVLLRRAAAERRRAATERALRPLRLARRAAWAAGAGATVAHAPVLSRHLRVPALPPAQQLLPSSGAPATVALGALFLAALVAALWLLWEEA